MHSYTIHCKDFRSKRSKRDDNDHLNLDTKEVVLTEAVLMEEVAEITVVVDLKEEDLKVKEGKEVENMYYMSLDNYYA